MLGQPDEEFETLVLTLDQFRFSGIANTSFAFNSNRVCGIFENSVPILWDLANKKAGTSPAGRKYRSRVLWSVRGGNMCSVPIGRISAAMRPFGPCRNGPARPDPGAIR